MNPKPIVNPKNGRPQMIQLDKKSIGLTSVIARAILQKIDVNYIVVINGGDILPYKIDIEKTHAEPNENSLVSWNGSRYDYSAGGIAV